MFNIKERGAEGRVQSKRNGEEEDRKRGTRGVEGVMTAGRGYERKQMWKGLALWDFLNLFLFILLLLFLMIFLITYLIKIIDARAFKSV